MLKNDTPLEMTRVIEPSSWAYSLSPALQLRFIHKTFDSLFFDVNVSTRTRAAEVQQEITF
jgi:hypothetical protein